MLEKGKITIIVTKPDFQHILMKKVNQSAVCSSQKIYFYNLIAIVQPTPQ